MATPTTIRRRLVTLALALMVPCVALLGLDVVRQFRADGAQAEARLRLLRESAAQYLTGWVGRTRQKLEVLAAQPALQRGPGPAREALLAGFLAHHPEYDGIDLLDRTQAVGGSAAAAPDAIGRGLVGQPALREVLEAGEFFMGRPFLHPRLARWTALIGLPVGAENGGRAGVLLILVNLERLSRELPWAGGADDAATGAVVADSGVIAFRAPAGAGWIGRVLPDFTPRRQELADGRAGEWRGADPDGRELAFAAAPLPGTPWIVFAAMPAEAIVRRAWARLWQALGWAGGVAVLGLGLVRRYAEQSARPMAALAAAARAQAAGRREVLALAEGPAEVVETALAFNAMVAARRAAEDALAESELRHRTVVEQTGQIIYDYDAATGRVTWLGRAALERILGCTPEALGAEGGAGWVERLHPDDRAAAVARLRECLASGRPCHAEYRMRHRDGTYRLLEERGVVLGGAGEARRMLGCMVDITERRAATAALEESERRYRTVLEQTGEMLYDVDLTTNRIRWFGAEAVPALTGWSEAEFQRFGLAEWEQRIHPEDRAETMRRFAAAQAAGGTFRAEYRFLHREGACRHVEDQGVFLREPDGKCRRMLGRMSDLTARRAAEEARAQLEKKLLETQKLESLGVLAGGIAHDFNNLLTGILGNAGLARLDLPAGWPGADYLGQIEKSAHRAADLCRQMLAYAGRGRLVIQEIDLNRLLEDTIELLRLSVGKQAALRYNLARPLPPVRADLAQLRQVLITLVVNASEALGEHHGTITLSTGRMRVEAPYLETMPLPAELAPGDYAFLEVGDTGCGMDRATVARVFDPFFTTKFTGRGLGLAAALGIVRGHGGAIKVYSEPGRGSTFKVLLPAAAGAAGTAPSAPAWSGSGCVLVVDDEEAVRGVAAGIVRRLGFEADIARDGVEAVARFQAGARYVAVLLDLTMPQLDGEETFRQLRGIQPEVKVVLMSGFNQVDAVHRFSGKGLAGFVQKPFELHALGAELRRVLAADGAAPR